MKKAAKIWALVLLVVTTIVSCSKNINVKSTDNLIVGKWKCVNYSEPAGDYDLAQVGSIWDFNSEGTLEFDTYHFNPSHIEHYSIAYTVTNKILVMHIPYEPLSFEITEISKEKLVLDMGVFHYEFEKEN
jgi:hypothetical protein